MKKVKTFEEFVNESKGQISKGDTVRLNDDVNLVSFMNLKGKDLPVKGVKTVDFASGSKDFVIVDGKIDGNRNDYEIDAEYVTVVKKS